MAKTVAQSITIVADALGKSENASSLSGALLKDRCVDFYNWSQHRVARFYSFHELNEINESAATVASVSRYPLVSGTNNVGLVRPKDIQSIRLIDGQNSRILTRKSQRWFDQKFPLVTNYADGRPYIYTRWGDNIELFRRPDAVYTLYIRYPQWPADVTIGSATSGFDEHKDQLLICGSILEGYIHFEEYESAKEWLQKFLGLLQDAVHAEGDVDWEPQAEAFSLNKGGHISGEPWIDPYAGSGDPLYDYPE
jgi:hypothetical protein